MAGYEDEVLEDIDKMFAVPENSTICDSDMDIEPQNSGSLIVPSHSEATLMKETRLVSTVSEVSVMFM